MSIKLQLNPCIYTGDTCYRHANSPRYRVGITFEGNGRTKQEFKAESDINTILARYQNQGVPPRENPNAPRWGDFCGYDYTEAMHLVADAQSLFEELPSSLRNRFENDPAKLLHWVHDPKNVQEATSLGFLDEQRLKALLPPPDEVSAAPAASQTPSPTPAASTPAKPAGT